MNRNEYLRRQQWDALRQLAKHELLDESYWGDGSGARWVVGERDTFVGKCEIVAGIGGSLIVHGDYDLCRFGHYGDETDAWHRLRWMADCTDVDYYVAQKASIGLRRQDIEEYDEDVARHEIIEHVKDAHRDGARDKAAVLRGALKWTECAEMLTEYLHDHSSNWDLWELRPGRVLSYRVVVSHVALNRCAWLLRARYGYAGPPACRQKAAA
jgi:hypothetical protein